MYKFSIRIIITYVYFLIFAQFAFLEHVKEVVGFTILKPVMGVMGVSGFVMSLLTGYVLLNRSKTDLMRLGFFICAIAACISYFTDSLSFLLLSSFLIGIGLSVLTVSLATEIGTFSSQSSIGIVCGIGTGVAYFICNVPQLFMASHRVQALFSGMICVLGALIPSNKLNMSSQSQPREGQWLSPQVFYYILLICCALVWFDSAAFFVIQQAGELKSLTWIGETRLWCNGITHLLFAICAGILIAFMRVRDCLFFAFVFLSIAVIFLQLITEFQHYSGFLYCAGVSLYSTALVAIPALSKVNERSIRAKHAGLLYGIAGWLGSAMGIGMAQDLEKIPYTFIIASALLLFFSNYKMRKAGTFLIICLCIFHANHASAEEPDEIRLGRSVYISEGCINCHSQYVRPVGKDIEMWGPYTNPESMLAEVPPLIGNRRNGPDLLNVGIRRSRDWLKIHMINPRLVSPDSNMPSYEYLFRDHRGESLVSYLVSLGQPRLLERLTYISSWMPKDVQDVNIDAKRLYQKNCAVCHGDEGRGDGLSAQILFIKPRNLAQDNFIFSNLNDKNSVSRVIKFGIYGTQMPGHEFLSDDEIHSLVSYIEGLR